MHVRAYVRSVCDAYMPSYVHMSKVFRLCANVYSTSKVICMQVALRVCVCVLYRQQRSYDYTHLSLEDW
jgi:hypothetical protein